MRGEYYAFAKYYSTYVYLFNSYIRMPPEPVERESCFSIADALVIPTRLVLVALYTASTDLRVFHDNDNDDDYDDCDNYTTTTTTTTTMIMTTSTLHAILQTVLAKNTLFGNNQFKLISLKIINYKVRIKLTN